MPTPSIDEMYVVYVHNCCSERVLAGTHTMKVLWLH